MLNKAIYDRQATKAFSSEQRSGWDWPKGEGDCGLLFSASFLLSALLSSHMVHSYVFKGGKT